MRKRKYTKEVLLPIVEQSKSYAQLIRTLGLKQTGGIHRLITMRIKEYGINTSHSWEQGSPYPFRVGEELRPFKNNS